MGKISKTLSLANRVVAEARKQLATERQENLTKQAKALLEEIQESKRTVSLLEKQLLNFMREVDMD